LPGAGRVRAAVKDKGIFDAPLTNLQSSARHAKVSIHLMVCSNIARAQFPERRPNTSIVLQSSFEFKDDELHSVFVAIAYNISIE